MSCDENCECYLCRELKGCEDGTGWNGKSVPDNFILTKSKANVFDLTKYTFFGMNEENNVNENVKTCNIEKDMTFNGKSEMLAEVKHKSVIYIDKTDENNNNTDNTTNVQNSCVMNEKVDEYLSLDSIEDSNVVNVIFKNTFSYATQIVNDVFTPETWSDIDSDDFPLGMEADYFNKIYMKQG